MYRLCFLKSYFCALVECFGDNLVKDTRRIHKTFYRGVSKILYPTRTISQFNGPLSTSDDIIVAQRFGGKNGMILALNYVYSTSLYSAKYFDCKFFSDHTSEKECLFIGGIPMMIIQNIVKVSNPDEQYRDYFNAINIINSLSNCTYNDDVIKGLYSINTVSIDLCCDLLSNQLQEDKNDDIPSYVTKLVEKYCHGLRYIITFWHQFENNQYLEPLRKLLSGKEVPFFHLDHLLQLFPNIEQIEYFHDSFHSKLNSNRQVTEFIIDILESITLIENKQFLKLKCIIIHHKLSVDTSNETIRNNKEWIVDIQSDKVIVRRTDIESKTLSFRLLQIQRGFLAAFYTNS